jgi:hypothetical protein
MISWGMTRCIPLVFASASKLFDVAKNTDELLINVNQWFVTHIHPYASGAYPAGKHGSLTCKYQVLKSPHPDARRKSSSKR